MKDRMHGNEYCHCYNHYHSGEIIGCHLGKDDDCCGGYITKGYWKAIREEQKRGW